MRVIFVSKMIVRTSSCVHMEQEPGSIGCGGGGGGLGDGEAALGAGVAAA